MGYHTETRQTKRDRMTERLTDKITPIYTLNLCLWAA